MNGAPALLAVLAFAGAFLLFWLELFAGKLLLPAFGGAAYVWTGSLMAYQGLLFLGYAYADAAIRRPRYRTSHLALLAVPLFTLPIATSVSPFGSPMVRLLSALLRSIGLPFFVLATTSTVLQGWRRRARPGDEAGAYALYAASNAGSLAALVLYPILLEPRLPLSLQARLWGWLYAGFAALHAFVLPGRDEPPAVLRGAAERVGADPARPGDEASWLLLALGPSAALLAATNLLTLDFAAVPLLWALPLALYLATFVLNFKRTPWYPRRLSSLLAGLFAVWAVGVTWTVAHSGDLAQRWQVLRRLWVVNKGLLVCGSLFVLCLICHRALALRRPRGPRAGRFYALIALGGWLGGVLVAVVMPLAARRLAMPELDAVAAGLLSLFGLLYCARTSVPGAARAVTAGELAAVTLVGAAGLWLYVRQSPAFERGTRQSLRDFYGYYRVVDTEGERRFFHGNTLHGVQSLDARKRVEPTLYFGPDSPIGGVFAAFGGVFRRVGVVGLGAGTLAAYGRPGQAFDFFELDPDVISLARRWFTYLADSRAAVSTVPGDARLSLERAPGGYDLLVLDAFSGGAIPVHTLTREAFALYEGKLAPGGLIAVHVTNRFLDLRPVLAAEARDAELGAVAKQTDFALMKEEHFYSSWVVLSRDDEKLRCLRAAGWEPLAASPQARAWTDDYASILAALRR